MVTRCAARWPVAVSRASTNGVLRSFPRVQRTWRRATKAARHGERTVSGMPLSTTVVCRPQVRGIRNR
jgi:hypothetical protein